MTNKKTRCYHYLFRPWLIYIADLTASNALRRLKVGPNSRYTDVNCYIGDSGFPNQNDDMILYVTVDISNPHFSGAIAEIQKSLFYLDHYSDSVDSSLCVIRFRYPETHRSIWDHFMNSRYSKMYDPETSPISYNNHLFKNEYLKPGKAVYEKYYGILKHSDNFFDAVIMPLLTQPTAADIKAIKAGEYDDKINEQELLNLEHIPVHASPVFD